jgi:hypothetical protein
MAHDPDFGHSQHVTEDQTLSAIRAALIQEDDSVPKRKPKKTRAVSDAKIAQYGLRAASGVTGIIGSATRRLRLFRPKIRHVLLAVTALMLVLRPQWVLIGIFVVIVLGLGTFIFVGSDRIWRGVFVRLAALDVRDPTRAAQVRDRLDRVACCWDAILDRFPESWVNGLYMPDLQAGTLTDDGRASI